MATVTNSSIDFSIEPTIAIKLNRIRSLKRTIGLAGVLFVSASLLIVVMLLAMGIDWLTLPGNLGWRSWLTAAVLTGVILFTIRSVLKVLKRENLLRRAASDVDRCVPGLQERWSTLADTSRKESNKDIHPAMYRLLSKEGASWAPTVEPAQVVSLKSLFSSIGCFAFTVIVFAILLFSNFELTSVLFRRFWSPTSNITMTIFGDLPLNVVVPQGEALTLEAFLDGRIPSKGTISIKDEKGELKQHVVTIEKNTDKSVARARLSYRVSEVEKPFLFQYEAGDARTNWMDVEIAQRPKISAVQFDVIPPSYTNRPTVRRKEFPASAKVLEGSVLEVAFRVEQELKEFQLTLDEKNSVNLQRDKDGWFRWRSTINENVSLTPVPIEVHGLKEKRPRTCHIRVDRDQAPTVKVLSPSSDAAVLPDEAIDIHVAGDDDNGIVKAELVIFTEKVTADGPVQVEKTVPIDLGDMKGAKHVDASIKVDLAEYNLKDGDSIRYVVKVYDNRAVAENRATEPSLIAKNLANQAQNQIPKSQAVANSGGKAQPMATDSTNKGDGTKYPSQSTAASAINEALKNGGKGNSNPMSTEIAQANNPQNPSPNRQASEQNTATINSQSNTPNPTQSPSTNESTNNRLDPQNPSQATPGTPNKADQTTSGQDPEKGAAKASASNAASNPGNPSQTGTQPNSNSSKSGSQPNSQNPQSNNQSSQSSNQDSPNSPSSSNPSESKTGSSSSENKSGSAAPDAKKDSNPQQKPEPTKNSGKSVENNLIAMSPSKGAQSETSKQSEGKSSNDPSNIPDRKQGDIITPEGMVPLKSDDKSKQNNDNASAGSQAQPNNPLDQRMLDIPQSGTSSTMQIKVDQYAGSYEGQKREKIALAISPILAELDSILTKGQADTNQVAERLEHKMPWGADLQQQIDRTEKSLKKAERLVAALQVKSKDTPYAFIGLQINLVSQSHITPARESLWEAQQSEVQRIELIRSAWQDISRALLQLQELNKTFERIHRDVKLADSMQKIKKMYQVYIENSMALLGPDKPGVNNDQRKMIEYDVDEDFLKRYKEVEEMRNKLMAELARILRDESDPRLMRRFMELRSSQAETLRDQISLLAERQRVIGREVKVWTETKEQDRPKLLSTIVQMRQLKLNEIATQAAAQNERFVTWLPLDLAVDNPAFKDSLELSKAVAAAAQILAVSKDLEQVENAEKLYNKLIELDAALRRVDLGVKHEKLVTHLLNRVADVRKLISLTSAWMKQSQLLASGNYFEEAAVEQYQLATETAIATEKLDRLIKSELSGNITSDATIAASLSEKATKLLTILDKEVSANQLAATHSMRRHLEAASVQKEEAAVVAFDKAEKTFDELMKQLLAELDKLPPPDPTNPDDPTLDQILSELEDRNDATRAELLFDAARGSNLQIVRDWMRPGKGGGNSGKMIRASINQDAKRAQQKVENMYKAAMERMQKEKELTSRKKTTPNSKRRDWNSLLSKLKDGLLQDRGELPPQDYRRAIEQYHSRISRMKIGTEEQQEQNQQQDQKK